MTFFDGFAKEKAKVGDLELTIETGKIARQASGAVVMRCADTVLLITAVCAKSAIPGKDFFPLSVEYRENTFASGKIPGGFFKREGRLSTREILVCRIIDRPIRPMFPKGFKNETQIFAQLLSADRACPPEPLAITGASTALYISNAPFHTPVGAVRVGLLNGEMVVNPPQAELGNLDLDMIVAASREAVVMVEGEANEVSEEQVLDALMLAHKSIQPLIDMQERLREQVGKEKMEFEPREYDEEIMEEVATTFHDQFAEVLQTKDKQARGKAASELKGVIHDHFIEKYDAAYEEDDEYEDYYDEKKDDINYAIDKAKRNYVRGRIIKEGKRIDGRGLADVRPIEIELGWLPRVHGSAVFTRGETQASATVTLGTQRDEQRLEVLGEATYERFLFHYNFPAFSVGEARPARGPGRREIGHGNLAGRSLQKVLPSPESFPYTIRVVSDITESNGSSSMASACGGSLAMMQAGVPLRAAVAGVAMGMIQEGKDIAILTDILGDEDHLGDMDFKVTGTNKGICAIQMDIKISGLTRDMLEGALEQARHGRLHILKCMNKYIKTPNPELSTYAPRVVSMEVNTDRIRDIIGPGGKTIKAITEQTGATIEVKETGKINIYSPNEDACQQAVDMINSLTREVVIGTVYLGTITGLKEFGAFVEVLPGQEGFLHISEIFSERIDSIDSVLKEGDELLVKVTEIDSNGKFRLSRKEAIIEQAAQNISNTNEEAGNSTGLEA